MRIATYNVNGVNGRLAVLLRWLEDEAPDIVCLQELKAPQDRFPEEAIRQLGYEALWFGQKSWNGVAILSRVGAIYDTRRGLPGGPDPGQSRYLEAAVNGVIVAALYLPNGNPRPGPKFDYKLAWFERLIDHAATLIATGAPVVLAGDFNVMPTDLDVYKPERWTDDALFAPEIRALFDTLLAQGWTDSLRHHHPDETIYTFWNYFRNAYAWCGSQDRPLAAQPRVVGSAGRVRRRPRGQGLGEDQRSCAGVDRPRRRRRSQEEARLTVAKWSAGVLIHRLGTESLEVLLVHPGGPFWRRRDIGAWQIPKGELEPGEDPEAAARREVTEELGIVMTAPLVLLGEVRQAGGKHVVAYAAEMDVVAASIVSNVIELEWPRGSGRLIEVPEVDEARGMSLPEARRLMLPSQLPFLDQLEALR